MVRQRYKEYDLGSGETTIVKRPSTEAKLVQETVDSPIGYYLFDVEEDCNFPLKDEWHFDIQNNEAIERLFIIYYHKGKVTVDSEFPELIFVNHKPLLEFNSFISNEGIIEVKDSAGRDLFIISKNRKLDAVEAKKIIGKFLVMGSDGIRQKQLEELQLNLEVLQKKLDGVNLFFKDKADSELKVSKCVALIKKIKINLEQQTSELEQQTRLLSETKIILGSQFSSEICTSSENEQSEIELKISEVNKEILNLSK